MAVLTGGLVLAAQASAEGEPSYLGPAAGIIVAAALIGYLMTRLRIVPIVGFLLAGVVIGPAQLGLVADDEAVRAAADIGVILLLFTIGIEFSISRLARVWTWIAVGGTVQILLATGAGAALTRAMGGSWGDGVFTGFLLALSSTAIVLKVLADRAQGGGTTATRGRLALAVLIAQDLAVVAMVLVVPTLASAGPHGDEGGADGAEGGPSLLGAGLTALVVIALVLLVARRVMPPLLDAVARTCSPEVFLMTIVAVCFGTAYLTSLAGVSVSLGAFLAGLVVSESRASTQALAEILPLQILFSAVFFVSVGMLLDLGFVMDNLALVLGGALVVLVVKTLTTGVAVALLRVPWRTAVSTGLLLAQVGEFSFVLLAVGTAAGLSPFGLGERGPGLVVAVTVLLMVLTPVLAALGARIERSGGRPAPQAERGTGDGAGADASADDDGPEGHVLVVGWGPTVLDLAATLRARGVDVLMTTLNPDGAAQGEAQGIRVLRGDPTKAVVLLEAGVATARLVVVAEDEPEQTARVVTAARALTAAPIVARPLGPVDLDHLARAGADHVIDSHHASAVALTRSVLARLGEPRHRLLRQGATVDVTRVVDHAWPPDSGCSHASAVRPVLPAAPGCVECLRLGTEWVHLRLCLTCGHVGCCDSSPERHARAHAGSAEHPVMASAEPGEHWAYCFVDDITVELPDPDDPPDPARREAGRVRP